MSNPFLEERLPIAVRTGASYADDYNVEISETTSQSEYRRLIHPYPRRTYDIFYTQQTAEIWAEILALYHRCYGKYAGFRVKSWDDFSSNNRIGIPTAFDQPLALISAGPPKIYQLQIAYGQGGNQLSIGLPVRSIFKPVTNTTLIAIGAIIAPETVMWTIDESTGRITFVADKTKTITGITKAVSAVITVGSGHGFNAGESVNISGVTGMTQINGMRGLITQTATNTITIAINSSDFGTYQSGGVVHTNPWTGETVYGGFEYDIPCRFNSAIDVKALAMGARETGQIELIELLNI